LERNGSDGSKEPMINSEVLVNVFLVFELSLIQKSRYGHIHSLVNSLVVYVSYKVLRNCSLTKTSSRLIINLQRLNRINTISLFRIFVLLVLFPLLILRRLQFQKQSDFANLLVYWPSQSISIDFIIVSKIFSMILVIVSVLVDKASFFFLILRNGF
jgi:hypothetical protein